MVDLKLNCSLQIPKLLFLLPYDVPRVRSTDLQTPVLDDFVAQR